MNANLQKNSESGEGVLALGQLARISQAICIQKSLCIGDCAMSDVYENNFNIGGMSDE